MRIGVVGSLARAGVGAALTIGAFMWQHVSWWDVTAALLVMPTTALASAVAVDAILGESTLRRRGRVPWSGVQIAAAAAVIVAVILLGTGLTYISPVNGGALYLFFGGSMLLASLVGYEGCELLALPNLVLRRRDAIWCPLYSPMDDVEVTARQTLP